MTETVETNVIKEPSRIIPKRLDARTMAVKSTGEVIRVTNDHRIIYAYLEDQFRGLTNPKNIAAGRSTGHFYDSDENLAIKNDVSKSTFKKVKKDLKALGLIDWKTPKAKKSGHACEYFVKQLIDIAHNLEFIYQELPNGQPSYDHERVSGLKAKRTKKAAAPTNEEKKGNGEQAQQQEHEQQSPGVSPTAENEPLQQVDGVVYSSVTDDPEIAPLATEAGKSDQGNAEQREGVLGIHSDQHDHVSADDLKKKPNLMWVRAPFDENGALVPEAKHWVQERGAKSEKEEAQEIKRIQEILVPIIQYSEQDYYPKCADIFDLKLWREGGSSAFGFMEYGAEHGETDVDRVVALIDQHYFEALMQITIFDEDGVVTEEFINALSGDAAPNRNADGSLQSIKYVYWVARHSQDERDGIPVRTREEYMAEAKPEYFPFHLLPDDVSERETEIKTDNHPNMEFDDSYISC